MPNAIEPASLRGTMAAARRPSAAALAQDDRLGGPAGERRYTCPSYEVERLGPPADGARDIPWLDLPGFRPVEAYYAALANVAPDLERRRDPGGPIEVLEWAPYPLATAEVAAICEADEPDIRAELARSEARFTPVGGDGYWSAG